MATLAQLCLTLVSVLLASAFSAAVGIAATLAHTNFGLLDRLSPSLLFDVAR